MLHLPLSCGLPGVISSANFALEVCAEIRQDFYFKSPRRADNHSGSPRRASQPHRRNRPHHRLRDASRGLCCGLRGWAFSYERGTPCELGWVICCYSADCTGYLAHKKPPPPRSLQKPCAKGPRVFLWRGAVSDRRGIPVKKSIASEGIKFRTLIRF